MGCGAAADGAAAAPPAPAPPLPTQLLRKYLGYARAHVHPRLSDAARDALQAFYLRLRADAAAPMGGGAGGAPITARQLESLVRLAEARARLDLREVVTRADAEVRGGGQRPLLGLVGVGGRRVLYKGA